MRLPTNLLTSLVAVAWVGSLWSVGLLVAPTLFAGLDHDRALAGSLVGKLFERQALLGASCGFLLLGLAAVSGNEARRGGWTIVAMLALLGVRMLLIAPAIAELRSAGAVTSSSFAVWHGASVALYLIECTLGGLLIVQLRRGGAQSGGNRSRGLSWSGR